MYLCMSVCLYACLSVCPSVCLSICLSCLSLHSSQFTDVFHVACSIPETAFFTVNYFIASFPFSPVIQRTSCVHFRFSQNSSVVDTHCACQRLSTPGNVNSASN